VASEAVGTNKAVTVTGYTISGSASGNYSLAQPTDVTVEITAKAVTISGVSIVNKDYDGSTTATITGTASYSGLASGDNFIVLGTPSATFNDPNVGTSKPVTVTGYLAPSANYYLTQPTGLTASIVSATPIAGNDFWVVDPNPNIISKISFSQMLSNDSDPNQGTNKANLTLTVNTNSLTAGYGAIRIKGSWVSYQPPTNLPVGSNLPTFTYTLLNTSNNKSATGTVTVSLTRDNVLQVTNFVLKTNMIPPQVWFSVMPTQKFQVEKTLSLSPTNWVVMQDTGTTPATNAFTSDSNGWLKVPDQAITNTNVSGGFYRLRWTP
jgi:hypothetical protein